MSTMELSIVRPASRVLYTQVTPASNVTTGETTLATYTLPANTLGANGQALRIRAWGSWAANGNNKQYTLYFGTQTVLASGVSGASNVSWFLDAVVTRATATTESLYGISQVGGTWLVPKPVAGTQDLTAPVVVKVTGQSGTASDDVTLTGMVMEWLPAGGTVV